MLTHPRFLLQLEIKLANGRTQRTITDESWRSTTDGPIRSSGIYDSEVDDARNEAELPGSVLPEDAGDAASL